MIVPKMLINTVANKLTKHFKLDKKVSKMEKRLNLLEKMVELPKNFKCNYKKGEK